MRWTTAAIWFRECCDFFCWRIFFMFNLYLLQGQVWWKGSKRFIWSTWPRGSARCLILFHFQEVKRVILSEDFCLLYMHFLFRLYCYCPGFSRWHRPTRTEWPRRTQGEWTLEITLLVCFKWRGTVMSVFCSQGRKGERGLPGPRGPPGFQVRSFR